MINAVTDCLFEFSELADDDIRDKIIKNQTTQKKITEAESLLNVNINSTTAENTISNLREIEIELLIKIYTIYDREVSSKGSVTAIPKLVDVLIARVGESAGEVIDWAIGYNSEKNPYIPFGAMRYAACKSFEQYRRVKEAEKEKEVRHRQKEEKAKIEKLGRLRAKAEKEIWNAIRRKDAKAIESFRQLGIDLGIKNNEGATAEELIERINEDFIEPTLQKRQLMYRFYMLAYESGFDIAKKRHLMTAALGYEPWCWRVVGITKSAIIEIANNNFRLPKGLQRDHFKKSRADTFNKIFEREYAFEEWWSWVWDNDETILMTKEEHNQHKNLNQNDVYKVDYTLGYFRNKAVVGMQFTQKKDGLFVKNLCEEHNIKLSG